MSLTSLVTDFVFQSIEHGTVRFKAQNRGRESRDREFVGGGNRYELTWPWRSFRSHV